MAWSLPSVDPSTASPTAPGGAPSRSTSSPPSNSQTPRALEILDHTIRQLERGELAPLEAVEALLAERNTPVARVAA